MSVADRNADRHFGQIINYYLDLAADGAHSPTGQPRTEKYLRTSRSLADHHIPGPVRQTRFVELSTEKLQHLVDEAAVKSEAAAQGLRRFLHDVDVFGAHIGILAEPRTKELSIPGVARRPRLLTDRVLGDVWIALRRNASGGSLPSRISCLASIVSMTTLQPIASVLDVRRDWLLSGFEGWVNHDSGHHVYVPTGAREHIATAIEVGNISHRERPTEWLFPWVGRNADPASQLSLQTVHDACKLVLEDNAKPQDLAFTGIERLREDGGPQLVLLADRIINECPTPPSPSQIAVLEAWIGKLEDLRKTLEAARWR